MLLHDHLRHERQPVRKHVPAIGIQDRMSVARHDSDEPVDVPRGECMPERLRVVGMPEMELHKPQRHDPTLGLLCQVGQSLLARLHTG